MASSRHPRAGGDPASPGPDFGAGASATVGRHGVPAFAGTTSRRRVWRAALLFVAVVVALAVLLLGGLATQPGRNLLASVIERNVDASGIRVAITNLGGWPPFRIGADRIVLLDRDGPFAEIDKLEASVRAGALLRGAIVLDSVAADRVAVMRRPLVQPKDEETAPGELELPIPRHLEHVPGILSEPLGGSRPTVPPIGQGSRYLQRVVRAPTHPDGRRGR